MNRSRRRLFVLGSAALISPFTATVKSEEKIHRIGLLFAGSPSISGDLIAPFTNALRDLGWIEGKNIILDKRWAEGNEGRYPGLAADLVAMRPDVIASVGATAAIKACQQATSTIPIVMLGSYDAVGLGLVASLAHPGGNTTGISIYGRELVSKQLEILHAAVPNATRIARLVGNDAIASVVSDEFSKAGKRLGLTFFSELVTAPEELDDMVASLKKQNAQAVYVGANPIYFYYRKKLADLLLKAKLPALFIFGGSADAGGLIAFGVTSEQIYRLGAGYIDKILKGAKPADLPVQQPNEFELVLNLKTAKALGIKIPLEIMLRANRVIE